MSIARVKGSGFGVEERHRKVGWSQVECPVREYGL